MDDQRTKLFPDEDVVEQVLGIVSASKRVMPAQFTSNGDKSHSFLVDFDIYWEDEYELANAAWNNASLTFNELNKKGINSNSFVPVLKVGEDLMLGSYILNKLGGSDRMTELTTKLLLKNAKWLQKIDVMETKQVQLYFNTCWQHGSRIAKIVHTENKPVQNQGLYFTDNPNLSYT